MGKLRVREEQVTLSACWTEVWSKRSLQGAQSYLGKASANKVRETLQESCNDKPWRQGRGKTLRGDVTDWFWIFVTKEQCWEKKWSWISVWSVISLFSLVNGPAYTVVNTSTGSQTSHIGYALLSTKARAQSVIFLAPKPSLYPPLTLYQRSFKQATH